jgi:hypothetical protein
MARRAKRMFARQNKTLLITNGGPACNFNLPARALQPAVFYSANIDKPVEDLYSRWINPLTLEPKWSTP